MSKATFDTSGLSGAFVQSTMNNQHYAVFQGDSSSLRPIAQTSANMTVAVAAANVESYYRQVWVGRTSLTYAGGNSPSISAPTSNSRIDILYITNEGVLTWQEGTESASPAVPEFVGSGIPICLVYCRTTMTKVVNYQDKDSFPTHGYLYADIRPGFARSIRQNIVYWYYPSNLATGGEKSGRIYLPFAGTIKKALIYCKTGPTGSDAIIDINKNGTTIWTTQTNRVTILAGANSGIQTSFDVTTFADGDYFTFDIDQIGSTVAGADLSVHLYIES